MARNDVAVRSVNAWIKNDMKRVDVVFSNEGTSAVSTSVTFGHGSESVERNIAIEPGGTTREAYITPIGTDHVRVNGEKYFV